MNGHAMNGAASTALFLIGLLAFASCMYCRCGFAIHTAFWIIITDGSTP
ncbi:hypothetical protein [Halomonas rhizosphaerae]|uniref:Lipoprotein n=1 Tax=Halomonas rhizosphaerae TaxID=3043296 RepID=A0ABT6UVM7_9GAMM|nr:hypothetical protein [Halomonas rhizosphaerae]MDI5890010.1 hypothetical protein [Halomonas rhizosphaerae]